MHRQNGKGKRQQVKDSIRQSRQGNNS